MDTNKWRPSQVGEAAMDAGDWRSQLQADSRQRIVNKIMDTLKRHLPFFGQDGLRELSKIVVRFEEKIYTAATSQSDYLRKISLRMLTMETKYQNSMGNPLQSNSAGKSNRPPDPGSFGMQPQVPNHGQSLSMPLPANQSQGRQPLLSQSIQNNIPPAGVQSSSDLSSALPPSSGLTQTPIPSIVGQNPNMQNMSGSSQNSLGNSMGQGVPSNVFANSQRQMPGRQQVAPQQQQPQQSQNSQNSQQYMYHQQMQHSLLKPKYQQGNMPQLVQQQQQQNLLQPTQLQSSQQSVMPTSSFMQLSVQSFLLSLQQNQQSAMQQSSQPMLQQHSQPVLRQQQQPQQVAVHQQQTPMAQQPILPQQQQQPLWRPSQVGEAAMDAGDWRSRLQADSRQRIVNKIMDTLKRHLPFSGQDGLQELSEIAVRFRGRDLYCSHKPVGLSTGNFSEDAHNGDQVSEFNGQSFTI
nr:mediator of RNA polymerase II transcription subunit 15a-like isoform X3 [Malus domestica]